MLELPDPYNLIIYCVGLGSLFIAILPKIKEEIKSQVMASPTVGELPLKEVRPGAVVILGLGLLITSWILGSIYLVVRGFLPDCYQVAIDFFLWTYVMTSSLLCAAVVIRWLALERYGLAP